MLQVDKVALVKVPVATQTDRSDTIPSSLHVKPFLQILYREDKFLKVRDTIYSQLKAFRPKAASRLPTCSLWVRNVLQE